MAYLTIACEMPVCDWHLRVNLLDTEDVCKSYGTYVGHLIQAHQSILSLWITPGYQRGSRMAD